MGPFGSQLGCQPVYHKVPMPATVALAASSLARIWWCQ